MLGYAKEQRSLTRNDKESLAFLCIGTFLEYFDLMLYIHLAILLNELFFSPNNSLSDFLITSFALCSTFIFRPIGAIVIGWIGDNIGRKPTIILTALLMSISCITIAILPPYAQIGVTASWVVIICRIVQGISSMGEIVGAELYLTEKLNPPIQYPAVALISIFASVGSAVALGIACLVTSFDFNWRIAFWFGAGIAFVGSTARTRLREAPEFADAKLQLQKTLEKVNVDKKLLQNNIIWKMKTNKKTVLSLFLIQCIWPVCFYIAYILCGNILKTNFEYSAADVIRQNFYVSMVYLLGLTFLTYLNYKIYPLKVLKVQLCMYLIFCLISPYLLNHANSAFKIFIIQILTMLLRPDISSAIPIFFKHFPIFKRFRATSYIFAIVHALMHIINTFALMYLVKAVGNWGLMIITIPIGIGYAIGLSHFIKLEKDAGNYPKESIPDYTQKVVA